MRSPFETALQFFVDAEWDHEPDKESGTIRAFHDGDTGTFPVQVEVDDQREQVVVYGGLPDRVDEEARRAVGTLLAGVNFGLTVACFEIDYGDGEVRCRAGLSFSDADLDPLMVRSLAAAVVVGFDLYRPAIEAVAAGADPLQELEAAGG